MNKPLVCILEDDPLMGESLVERFRLEGFEVDWFQRVSQAEQALSDSVYALLLSDIRLPDASGEAMFHRCRQRADLTLPPTIFITGYGSIDTAVGLLKAGAADYVVKPFDLDELMVKVSELTRVAAPPDKGARADAGEAGVLGVSPAMRRLEQQLTRLAGARAGVMISGESGVGKEFAARFFHRAGGPSSRPFIAVNCGALPESLLEAELFGHERGAFTGAQRVRRGVFEQAQGGVLFLDEIGDMPLSMQVRLLRVLQERRVTRLGGEQSIPLDFTLISATHRDLRSLVAAGQFREDLFYRINTVQVKIPPLRERPEDIPWFAKWYLEGRAASEPHAVARSLSPEALRALLRHDWPGNVRELEHCLEKAMLLSDAQVLTPEDLFDEDRPEVMSDAQAPLSDFLRECEREHIEQALTRHGGQVTATATSLGISRKNLWEKMRKLAIGGKSSG